jgi:hypothetical protein
MEQSLDRDPPKSERRHEEMSLEVSSKSVVERTAGALKAKASVENLRKAAERAIAEEAVERSRNPESG